MTKPKDRGCTTILLIGLCVGMLTGFTLGMNWSTWKYADLIATGYSEIIRTQDGGMFVKQRGMLYKLEAVKSDSDTVEDKIIDAIEKHDKNMIEVEKAEIYHDK